MSRAGRTKGGPQGRASGHYGKSGGKSPLPTSKDELWPPELVPECPTDREREEKMNMLVAISETVLLRWRESPDFNLLLVTFVKEVEGRETTWVVRGHAGMARGRDGPVRLPMSSVGGRQFFFFLAAA